jgi:MFS family permease
LLFAGQAIAFAGAAGLAVTVVVVGIDGLPGPWPIYLATAVIGLGAAVILPSLQAVVPALVRQRDLDRAIALNSMTFNIARSIGPIAAGATVAAAGATWAFGINALTFVPLLIVLLMIEPRGRVEPENGGPSGVRDGVEWIRARPQVIGVLVATLVVGWTSDPFSTLMPAMADELGGGDTLVGLLVGAFGIGAAVVAPMSDRVRELLGRSRMIPTGLGLVAIGLATMVIAPVAPVALLGAACSGSGFLLGVTATNSELQKAVPEELRGRVMAWWSVAFLGCRPVAAITDGAIADLTDIRVALAVASCVALGAGVVGFRRDLTTSGVE